MPESGKEGQIPRIRNILKLFRILVPNNTGLWWLIDWLGDWLIGRLIDCSIDWYFNWSLREVWGFYKGVSLETRKLSPSVRFQLHLVQLILHLAITKTILVRSLIIHMFTRVENQPLKPLLKQKRCITYF